MDGVNHSDHGHVFPNADGSRARCGAERHCAVCQADAKLKATLEGFGNNRMSPATEMSDSDIPVGTLDMKTGGGVNNYVPPSINVSGALARLLATNQEA
jgi:hypothetical protein